MCCRLQEYVAGDEEDCQHPHGGGDFLGFATEGVDEHIGNHADEDAVADAVAEGHEDDGEEGGDGLAVVVQFNLLDGAEHHQTHDDQRGSGCRRGDVGEDGRKEERDGKAADGGECGEARAATGSHTGSTLHVGGGCGGAEAGAAGGGNSVGHEYFVDAVDVAFFVDHAGFL